jgi:hypothetical protein
LSDKRGKPARTTARNASADFEVFTLGGNSRPGKSDQAPRKTDGCFAPVHQSRFQERPLRHRCAGCTPASGWEKGQVENQVGLVRELMNPPIFERLEKA